MAAAGSDSAYGLPGVTQRPRVRSKITVNGVTLVARESHFDDYVRRSVWASRGWTYQEHFFSRRCLIFTDEQVLFQCRAMFRSEGLHEDLDAAIDPDQTVLLCPADWNFTTHVQKFSGRYLTYDFDILRAAAGLFHSLTEGEAPVEQYWGMPLRWAAFHIRPNVMHNYSRNDVAGAFLRGLLWHPDRERLWPEHNLQRAGFPSWSWAGWKTPVHWKSVTDPWPFVVPVYAETALGGLVEVDEAFAEALASAPDRVGVGYNKILQIETQVLQVHIHDWEKYECSRPGETHLFARFRCIGHTENTQFAIVRPGRTPTRGLLWPILRTAGAAKVESLCKDSDVGCFECMVLDQDLGLVVHTAYGISKRIGIVFLLGKYFVDGVFQDREHVLVQNFMEYYEDVPEELQEDFDTMDLREHFPSSVKRVRLG